MMPKLLLICTGMFWAETGLAESQSSGSVSQRVAEVRTSLSHLVEAVATEAEQSTQSGVTWMKSKLGDWDNAVSTAAEESTTAGKEAADMTSSQVVAALSSVGSAFERLVHQVIGEEE